MSHHHDDDIYFHPQFSGFMHLLLGKTTSDFGHKLKNTSKSIAEDSNFAKFCPS